MAIWRGDGITTGALSGFSRRQTKYRMPLARPYSVVSPSNKILIKYNITLSKNNMNKYMSFFQSGYNPNHSYCIFFFLCILFHSPGTTAFSQTIKPPLQYTVSMPRPATHYYHIELYCTGWSKDTLDFKMPKWMPGSSPTSLLLHKLISFQTLRRGTPSLLLSANL